jgi:hypothetical protein
MVARNSVATSRSKGKENGVTKKWRIQMLVDIKVLEREREID